MLIPSPRYSWKLLRAGPIWLDGGGMFGIIPRTIWNRRIASDEQGRIQLAHNCLLLTPASSPSPHFVLIETGSGDKFDEKHRRIFGLSNRTIINAVEEIRARCDAIGHVIVSHLHFDHAGGLTRASPAGPRLTFPNAQIIAQRREWENALANRSTMTRTYLRDHLDPIAGVVRLIDSPPPYPAGHRLQRNDLPPEPMEARETEVLPGIFVFLTPGHTWGQQAIRFTDELGQDVVFTPDILPTVQHVGATYNLAYDVEPFMSGVCRHWFLREAAARNWLLVLDHEPGNPVCRVRPDGDWFSLIPARAPAL